MNPFFDPELVVSFVDRETELSRLRQLVSFSVDQEDKLRDYQRIVHIIGKSNVGKTFLLQRFGYELSQSHAFLSLYITFEKYIDYQSDKFVLRTLQYVDEIISAELSVKPQLVETSNIAEYSDWVVRGIEQLARIKIFVLLLDEVSMLSVSQIQLLEHYLLARVLLLPNIIVVLAGRHLTNGWKEFVLRPYIGNVSNVIELSGFDYENTGKQIQAINPHINALAAEIHEITGGSPGNNRKIVEQLGDPPQINYLDAIRTCNQEFYGALAKISTGIPKSAANELLPALEALCVLQDFDKEYEMPVMLSAHLALNGPWTVHRCAALWNILSEVQVGPGKLVNWDMEKNALAMEEQTRFNLEKELKIRDVNLWKTLHCTAMNMYAEWTHQYGMDSIFADKAEYHKRKLIDAGIDPETCG